jgi:hypothetical protein
VLALAVGFVSATLYSFICRKQVKKVKTISIAIEAPTCACGDKTKSKKVQPLLGVVAPKLKSDAVATKSKKKAVK